MLVKKANVTCTVAGALPAERERAADIQCSGRFARNLLMSSLTAEFRCKETISGRDIDNSSYDQKPRKN